MMVQILPPKTNLGTQIGQAMGQGLGSGMQQGADIGLNRGMLRSGLSQVAEMSRDPNFSPFQRNLGILEALSGIPGSERYVAQILPELNKQMLASSLFGTGGPQSQGGGPGGGVPNFPGQPQGQGGQPPFVQPTSQFEQRPATEVTSPGLPQPQHPTTGGVLPRVIPQESIAQHAQSAVAQTGDPNAAALVQEYYQNLNNKAETARTQAESKLGQIGIDPSEMPEAMRIGERYGYMPNVNEWATATKRDFLEYKNLKNTLSGAFAPGFWRGMVTSGETREKSLANLSNPVGKMVKMGFEQEARQTLAEKGLSKTEMEEVIHPLTQSQRKSLEGLPKGPYEARTPKQAFKAPFTREGKEQLFTRSYDEDLTKNPEKTLKQTNMLSSFIKKNTDENTSLLALRNQLWKKGYDWRQISSAFQEAQGGKDAIDPTAAQINELTELQTQPPRQSLSDIFMDWPRVIQLVKGEK